MLPVEKQFYTQNGPVINSGLSFVDALEQDLISKESFEFHHKNGDFVKWIDEVLGQPALAKSVKRLRSQSGYAKKLREHYK
jgi:hypothetical protein